MDPLHSGNIDTTNMKKIVPGTTSVRQRIKQRRQEEIDILGRYAKNYLDNYVPQKNTVSVEEFNYFIPLFNKQLLSQKSREEIDRLSYEYNMRFCMQEPINIIDSKVLDPEGVLWPKDMKKHKVVTTLPPRIRRLESINKLGGNIVAVASECIANNVNHGSPFDGKGEYYSQELAKLISYANRETSKAQDEQFDKYSQALLNKSADPQKTQPSASQTPPPEQQSQEPEDTSLLDSAEWE